MRRACADGPLLRRLADVLFLCAVVDDLWAVEDFALDVVLDVLPDLCGAALCVVVLDGFLVVCVESGESAATGATRTSAASMLAKVRTAAVAKSEETGDFIDSI